MRTGEGEPGGPEAGAAAAAPEVRRRRRFEADIQRVVLPELARALGALAARRGLDPSSDGVRQELELAARTIVARALFRLHAERPGFLPLDQLGHVYEGLLSLRLDGTAAGAGGGATAGGAAGATGGTAGVELRWRRDSTGRKGAGAYYTRRELVRHLVGQALAPAFAEHLGRVRATAATDPELAAAELLDFAVLDPACGSANFLVPVVDELAAQAAALLGDPRLAAVAEALGIPRHRQPGGALTGDLAMLRRLLVERCVYGVDLSETGAEVAKLTLRAATAVAGLPPADLDRNILIGDALSGPVDGPADSPAGASAGDLRHGGLRQGDARYDGPRHGGSRHGGLARGAAPSPAGAPDHGGPLNWRAAFPLVFSRDNPGFDVVLGNPPWEELTVERLAFYGGFAPGLRGLPQERREAAIAELLERNPGLREGLAARRELAALARALARGALAPGGQRPARGDPDLYKYFCMRYRELLRDGGRLGVVLPRSAFAARGSEAFRRWLFEDNLCERLDFLVNRRMWAFQTHQQYTVALVAARRARPVPGAPVRVAGTAASLQEWVAQAASPALPLPASALGPGLTVPLLRNQAEADLLAKLRRGRPFPYGAGGRWRCFPVRELDETNDRDLWRGASAGDGTADGAAVNATGMDVAGMDVAAVNGALGGAAAGSATAGNAAVASATAGGATAGSAWLPLWKGESFEQYDPHGAGARRCPLSAAVMARVRKMRPGGGSVLAGEVTVERRRQAVLAEPGRARVAFRDVSRATDARTVRACLIPPWTLLTNKAPYLAFVDGDERDRALCLGVMNSLPFDWQARRFVEINLNFFVLEGLTVPDLGAEDAAEIARCAARLSCVDERFAGFAAAAGVATGPLREAEREALRLEIDARVARSWGLTAADLAVLFADFTLAAVGAGYRERLTRRLAELGAAP